MSDKIQIKGVTARINGQLPKLVKNPLNRPKISYKKPIIALVIYLVVLIGALFISRIVAVVWTVLYMALIMKRAAIWMIYLYQNKAPSKVRLRCVFEPSCSEYAILAIQKYGVIIGGFKIIGRLRRCRLPNGGPDYP